MFHFIKGRVDYIGDDFIVLENRDIGYKIFTSLTTVSDIGADKGEVTIYTQMVVREDDISLYGFLSREELKMFQLLTTVSGVGAKVGLGILSSIHYQKLAEMIYSEDVTGLTKAHGVGKKTAQRIILELKEKIRTQELTMEGKTVMPPKYGGDIVHEAIEALVSLGYGKNEAASAVSESAESCSNLEQIIKNALKVLAR
ncbi:Holliday junction DNA helicase subunit RuvA [Geosporobacter subterraneus DSM 17957]|uniref:Holliday junction branch migration complex subunit RuvA n=1 Tax=Geosporobacter subterraneus DSM 17957 TaxID=1121919 RepID=A0A1M6BR92_9FIRM|nr:Holliday junction branch migration protein RuvA [Geosporobacter subterraneus]SHI51114.1 Holliday junction DNA helicase subunit RuvA [Geosporobacter subterraneus DSM 17957]